MAIKDRFVKVGVEIEDFKIKGTNEISGAEDVRKLPMIMVPRGTKEAAIKASLIPESYIDMEFDAEEIKNNILMMRSKEERKFNTEKLEGYLQAMKEVQATLIANKLPEQSLLLGAPAGFGQIQFAVSCILKLYGQMRRCTPLISLTDLAQIKLDNEKRLLGGVDSYMIYKKNGRSLYAGYGDYEDAFYNDFESSYYEKRPINIIDRYSWNEYMNCDILFCYFTDVGSKELESEMIKAALNVRGKKGLPTIAFIFTSLNPYKGDRNLYEYVWSDILAYDDSKIDYGRMKYVHCYKNYNLSFKEMTT